MKVIIHFKSEISRIAIFLILIFETAHAIDKTHCGTVELIGGKGHEAQVDGDETKIYTNLSIEILNGAGSGHLCLPNISDPNIQNPKFTLVQFKFKPFTDKCELLFCGITQKSGTGNCYELGNGNYSYLFPDEDFSITSVMCGCSVRYLISKINDINDN